MRGGPGGSKRGASHSGPLRSGTRAGQGTGLRMKRRVHEAGSRPVVGGRE